MDSPYLNTPSIEEAPAEPRAAIKPRNSNFEMYGYNHPSEIEVRAPKPKLVKAPPILQPSNEEVQKLALVNGNKPEEAWRSLVLRYQSQLTRLSVFCPQAHDNILEDLDQIEQLRQRANETLRAANELVQRIIDLLTSRAACLHQVAEETIRLESAKMTLEDHKACLSLGDVEIAGLMNKAKHLPTRISELQKEAAGFEPEIRQLAGDAKIELPRFIELLHEEVTRPPHPDHRVRELIRNGFMAMPATAEPAPGPTKRRSK